MEPLNYLRQASEYMKGAIPMTTLSHPKLAEAAKQILDGCHSSPKFVLPVGGRIFEDDLRGLPAELRLPFPEIVIEFKAGEGCGIAEQIFGAETISVPKRLVYAQERDGWVDVCAFCCTEDGVWVLIPVMASIHMNDGTVEKDDLPDAMMNRVNANFIETVLVSVYPIGEALKVESHEDWELRARVDINDEVNAVLSLVEALACINVSHTALPVRKMNKSSIRKGALPFDEYRILTVKQSGGSGRLGIGGNRSPREHLRRGHIRRLPDTRTIWVNSCVVNSGAAGKITTGYDMRKAA